MMPVSICFLKVKMRADSLEAGCPLHNQKNSGSLDYDSFAGAVLGLKIFCHNGMTRNLSSPQ
jgi:hypothetical protein